jgi:hypothetical protein
MANHPYDPTLSLFWRLIDYPREPLNRYMPWYEKLIRRFLVRNFGSPTAWDSMKDKGSSCLEKD